MRLLIAGGGTGGHLFPGIAIAEAWRDRFSEGDVLFVGTEKGIEMREVPKAGFRLKTINVSGLKRVGILETAKSLARLPLSAIQCFSILREFRPDAVIGVGGYASGPLVMTAAAMGIPTAVCEQNSVPGVTNRALARVVRRIYGTFEGARAFFPGDKYMISGNPVRRSFVDKVGQLSTPAADIDAPRRAILICGGSQGARPLNQTLPGVLSQVKAQLGGTRLLITHQAGRHDVESVEAAYADADIEADVVPFIDDMMAAYDAADLVVCRAGATTIAELTVLGKPSVLIPFPQAADDHQTKNARELADQGAAIIVAQPDLSDAAQEISSILADDDRRMSMAQAAQSLGRPEAAAAIAAQAAAGFVPMKGEG